jgi:hypothetical protein
MIDEVTGTFQVMNPELLICTMDPSAKLNIELHISKGRGYVPSEDNRQKEAPFGFIPIDSIHTPIKNVKYAIENTNIMLCRRLAGEQLFDRVMAMRKKSGGDDKVMATTASVWDQNILDTILNQRTT